MKPQLIAITGGIGSGKSVVSRILAILGYPVFDCDSEAKALMDKDPEIHRRLAAEIHPATVVDGLIDRRVLAEIVFADREKLAILNSIVHSAVKERLTEWCHENEGVKFVETAILYSSGLNRMVDAEWHIDAPTELRVERVMKRNGLTREQVLARIESQKAECGQQPPRRIVIINDGTLPLLPQITAELLESE